MWTVSLELREYSENEDILVGSKDDTGGTTAEDAEEDRLVADVSGKDVTEVAILDNVYSDSEDEEEDEEPDSTETVESE